MSPSRGPSAYRGLPLAVLSLVVSIGGGLRARNASTAAVHDDEVHYIEDAAWLDTRTDFAETSMVAREHPRDRLRPNPVDGGFERWGGISKRGHLREVLYTVARSPALCHVRQTFGVVAAESDGRPLVGKRIESASRRSLRGVAGITTLEGFEWSRE